MFMEGEWTYVQFEDFGYFVFKPGHLNGHCHAPGHIPKGGKCHIDRSWSESSAPGRGRVLGLVAAWLMTGRFYEHSEHKGAAVKKLFGSFTFRSERQAGRNRLKELGLYDMLTAAERPKADPSEDSEPEEVQ